ncbi:MAG: 1-deoxy-D-xylulose-5-phosphate synthase [Candidatus Omnitrophica bacterium 4484_70.2]|nr:MAG: 1-deoxy-D-xylulose-5-phosphate synthase [Candidatus Omnitrophica bacterium 4484_70.2]
MLEKINSPQDLRRLNLKELSILAEEIRKFIIKAVKEKGGHLASSLGAVEICIALHYSLNTPSDDLIFDVGHQAYAHKIITGRKEKFYHLREYRGLSGFPNPEESEYDLFISGHASTALSWALGVAEAKKIKGEKSKTVAVIGDGALTGGMCFEALNKCGELKSDVLVILNHNQMSISASVGALSKYLTKIISLPIYNKIKTELEKFLSHLPSLAKRLAQRAKKFEEAIKGLIVPGIFFEELGFRYFGPIDGHNLEILIPTLKNILKLEGPRLLHIITRKGKGLKEAEKNPEKFHSFSVSKKKKITFTDTFSEKIVSLARENKRIVTITAAMPRGTGLDYFKKTFPERFFDVGIAEANAVGLAAGLAKKGLIPVVAIYSTFLQRAFDQVIHDIALQNLKVIFIIDRAGFVGEDGPTHHGIFDISYLRMIPNLVCMAPKDKEELEDMLEFALEIKNPVSIRFPKEEAYSLRRKEKITFAKAEVLEEGKDLCIIALGSLVKEALKAKSFLEKEGISAQVINARFIKPLDRKILKEVAYKFNLVVVLEEGIIEGGFGSAILEFYERENLLDKIKVKRIGIKDEFPTFAKRDQLIKLYGLDGYSIYQDLAKLLKEELLWQK